MFKKISLKTRVGLILGSLIMLFVIVGATKMLSDSHISGHLRMVKETAYPLALNSTYLQLWVERNLAIINAAALAGRADLLTPLEEAEQSLQECFHKLSAIVSGAPELAAKIRTLDQRYASARKVGLQWVEATLAENWELEPQLSYEFVQLRGELEQIMTGLKDDGVEGFTGSLDQISKHMQSAWTQTLALFAVGFLGFILLNLRLYRAIALPLLGLLQVIKEVRGSTAQLSQRVVVDSQDEIGQLGTAFNVMLDDLETSQTKLKEQTEGLEQLVQERTGQLEQEKETLRESERHLKAIWDSTPSGIIVIDARSRKIVDANPFALKLMGRTRQEVLNHVCHSFVCPAETGKCPISDLGQTVDGSERQLVGASGTRSAILKTVVPFTARGQELLIESFIDMTGLKAAQDQLKAAVLAADAANRAKSEFLANMSHELRTPLNHIIGFTELVAGRDFGELNEVQEEYLNDVLSSSKHLLSLINDILDLSKVEAGRMELEPSDVNLALVLENSLVMIKEKATKHSLRISMEIGDIPETIPADERKVKQIVYNLLSNAVKFTSDGGEIRLSAGVVPVIPPASGDNGDKGAGNAGSGGGATPARVRIAVADTGLGLEPQDLERIFRPFEQADSSISRKYQGTGLGLSLTQKLVAMHGGTIWAESEGLGRGATFYFTLSTQIVASAPGDDLGQ